MSCDICIVLLMTYEGSAFIALFLDMRNVVSSHFLTVCTVQVSVPVSQPRACVGFCIAPSVSKIFLFKVRQL